MRTLRKIVLRRGGESGRRREELIFAGPAAGGPSLYLTEQRVFETRGGVQVRLCVLNLRTRLRCVARIMFGQGVSLWWGGSAVVLGGRLGRCGKLNIVNGKK